MYLSFFVFIMFTFFSLEYFEINYRDKKAKFPKRFHQMAHDAITQIYYNRNRLTEVLSIPFLGVHSLSLPLLLSLSLSIYVYLDHRQKKNCKVLFCLHSGNRRSFSRFSLFRFSFELIRAQD